MCGILVAVKRQTNFFSSNKFTESFSKMAWRGPDNSKIISLECGRVMIGHHRLSILDPEHRSDQPFWSRNSRYLIVYNGEIYNHHRIRKKLKLECRTLSDTETIVESFSLVGDRILNELEGMFAFVIYDNEKKIWFSARDHLGIKPLFIYHSKDATIISSESSVAAKLSNASVDEDSISEWKIARRPSPGFTFFEDVEEHLPGMAYYSGINALTLIHLYQHLQPAPRFARLPVQCLQ